MDQQWSGAIEKNGKLYPLVPGDSHCKIALRHIASSPEFKSGPADKYDEMTVHFGHWPRISNGNFKHKKR